MYNSDNITIRMVKTTLSYHIILARSGWFVTRLQPLQRGRMIIHIIDISNGKIVYALSTTAYVRYINVTQCIIGHIR